MYVHANPCTHTNTFALRDLNLPASDTCHPNMLASDMYICIRNCVMRKKACYMSANKAHFKPACHPPLTGQERPNSELPRKACVAVVLQALHLIPRLPDFCGPLQTQVAEASAYTRERGTHARPPRETPSSSSSSSSVHMLREHVPLHGAWEVGREPSRSPRYVSQHMFKPVPHP